MISIAQALDKVILNSKPTEQLIINLNKATNKTIAKSIVAPINMPPFRQSAMDGYAVNLHTKNTYKCINEIKAGDTKEVKLTPGQAIRIFTGAAVPKSANAVVMQEKVIRTENFITVKETVLLNDNIRALGEQIKKNDIALHKGTKLTPAAIGFLASLGINKVSVYKTPNIAIISTGNELVKAGSLLTYGKVYESNSVMLQSALNDLGYYDISTIHIKDNYQNTINTISQTIRNFDIVLITGGISVGDYDFVGKSLTKIGVEEIFYNVKQKPGKPLYFGKKDKSLIFALPGNPAAALTCFYVYIKTALAHLSGNTDYSLVKKLKKSTSSFTKKGNRPQFLKALVNENNVTILEGQSSAMLQTFALANALAFIPENVSEISVGDTLETLII